jgi:hypothetical protein
MWRSLLLFSVAAVVAAGSATAANPDYCCLNANLKASYDAKAKRISAHWAAADGSNGVTAVELRAGERLGADGIVDLSGHVVRTRTAAGSATVGAGSLVLLLSNHASVFVQVRFTCASPTVAKACKTGAFWSNPVQVMEEDSAQVGGGGGGGSGTAVDSTGKQYRVHIKGNGTRMCNDLLTVLGGIIHDLNENTAEGNRLKKLHKPTGKVTQRQAELLADFKRYYTAALRDCKART